MAKVKIISNPYEKNIEYFKYNESENKWDSFYDESNTDGALLDKKFIEDFFPFKVKDIVDVICTSLGTNKEKVELVFEGTKDEYDVLAAVVNSKAYKNRIELKEFSKRHLEDANIVKPLIRDLIPKFMDISETINSFPAIKEQDEVHALGNEIISELNKAAEATEDMVPICVVGNYSSGKSTFINALIGREILPNGDQPLTALVYKIIQSKDYDTAVVSYTVNGVNESIEFNTDSTVITPADSTSPIITNIKNAIDDSSFDIFQKTGVALEIINSYANKNEDSGLTENPISVSVPFGKGLLSESEYNYIIIDTPGSNASTKANHTELLIKSMENMTNGIPVFVTMRNTLSTIDNEKFIEKIAELDELDSRFTMIIVNRADDTRLPQLNKETLKEFKEDIRGEGVPQRLYQSGVFFASSLVALGDKLDGEFRDEHYDDVYQKNIKNFSDPSDKYYKQLYRYNIMPEHIESRSLKEAKKCNNLVYLNSGLFSIENEIEYFSNNFAAYNKCFQSYKHLNAAINKTKVYIEQANKLCYDKQEKLEKQFKDDKSSLERKIEVLKSDISFKDCEEFKGKIEALKTEEYDLKESENLELRFNQHFEKEKTLNNYYEAKHRFEDGKKPVIGSFKTVKKPADLKRVVGGIIDDGIQSRIDKHEFDTIKGRCEKNASETLLKEIKQECISKLEEATKNANKISVDYWSNKGEEAKTRFINLIVKTDALTEEKRDELKTIVMEFPRYNPDFSSEKIFDEDKLYSVIKFPFFTIGNKNKLDFKKVSRAYKEKIVELIGKVKTEIESGPRHDGCFDIIKGRYIRTYDRWLECIENKLKEKLVEYNTSLYEESKEIEDINQKIEILNAKKDNLELYSDQIYKMIYWKE